MDVLLQKKLFEKYPVMFQDRVRPVTESTMGWGIEVGDGWFGLVDVLCEQLQGETDQRGAPQVVVSEIKEKYGELRFYVGSASERQEAMIEFAEALSSRVCEACGAPGSLRSLSGWYAARCDEHAVARGVP